MTSIKIRQASSNDLEDILLLFKETIEHVNARDYSFEQIRVWSNGAYKKEKWLARIGDQFFVIATVDTKMAGFGSMTNEGYLDFMYVSKDHQRMGVAKKIYDCLEEFAASHHVTKISSDVSITAKPFFEKQGFHVVKEQQVSIDGIELTNYKMEKMLR